MKNYFASAAVAVLITVLAGCHDEAITKNNNNAYISESLIPWTYETFLKGIFQGKASDQTEAYSYLF